MNQFVPLTDELLYQHPDLILDRLIPFNLDYACHRWMEAEVTKKEGSNDEQ